MEIENETQTQFALKHGDNVTDRMAQYLLNAIIETLAKHGIEYHGHKTIKQLGEVDLGHDGEYRLLFDVKNPNDIFDHVEFKVVKTGWGRAL